VRVAFSIFNREIFSINIDRELELLEDWEDWEGKEDDEEYEDEEYEDEDEEEEDEDEEEDEEGFLRWGEPAVFERTVFTP
jgi:hypothetical protein